MPPSASSLSRSRLRTSARSLLALALAVLSGCARRDGNAGLKALEPPKIEAHLQFLAGDLLEGRAPGTRGAQLAASYIAAQFAQAGLEPAVGDSSYFQSVPMLALSPQPRLAFRASGGASLAPTYGAEFLAWSRDTAAITAVEAELVFVGYGITAPEYEWDDYKEADVRGKVVLALDGDPGRYRADRFRGDTATRYSAPAYKFDEAALRGAVGVVLVHSSDPGYVWDAIRNVRVGEQLALDGVETIGTLLVAGWVTGEVAGQVAAMGGLDFAALLETAREPAFRPIETEVSVSLTVRNTMRRFVDANVAGLLPGSDPRLSREVVVITAHYDHIGIGEPVEGDSIYNGAYDNASGTALLISLADAFGQLRRRPARSVLFLAVTGKEAGCLGSRYYVRNPLWPLAQTVAAVNVDGVNLWGPTEDIVVLWAEAAGMRDAAWEAASDEGLRLETEFAPEWGVVYRSDQVSFANAGIPSVLLGHGQEYVGRMPGWGRQTREHYLRTVYHKPGDEYQSGLDLRGAAQQARVAFRLVLSLANSAWRPVQREGWEMGPRRSAAAADR